MPATQQPERASGGTRVTEGGGTRVAAGGAATVHELIHGRWKAEVVGAMVRLSIPDLLGSGGRSVEELSALAGAQPDRLRRLLVLADRIGLVTLDARQRYHNTAVSDLLRTDHPQSMTVDACHVLSGWARIAWDNLDHAVRTGGSGFEAATGQDVFSFLAKDPDEESSFHAFQDRVTRRNAAMLLARHPLPSGATVVDVGGGQGTLLRTMVSRDPTLRGVLFDREAAIGGARAALRHDPLGQRIRLVEGDFFRGVPGGGDVYVLSHVLHDWPDEPAVRILHGIARQLREDSYLLIVENLNGDEDDDVGLLVAYLDVLMLAAWGSRERTLAEYGELVQRAGMSIVDHQVIEPRSRLAVLTARLQASGDGDR